MSPSCTPIFSFHSPLFLSLISQVNQTNAFSSVENSPPIWHACSFFSSIWILSSLAWTRSKSSSKVYCKRIDVKMVRLRTICVCRHPSEITSAFSGGRRSQTGNVSLSPLEFQNVTKLVDVSLSRRQALCMVCQQPANFTQPLNSPRFEPILRVWHEAAAFKCFVCSPISALSFKLWTVLPVPFLAHFSFFLTFFRFGQTTISLTFPRVSENPKTQLYLLSLMIFIVFAFFPRKHVLFQQFSQTFQSWSCFSGFVVLHFERWNLTKQKPLLQCTDHS